MVVLKKKVINYLVVLMISLVMVSATSVEAEAAVAAVAIEFHQSSNKSDAVLLTKNLTVRAANNGSPSFIVSLVNSKTNTIIANKTISNTGNQMVDVFNMSSITAGYYYVQLTCSTGSQCKGSAIIQGN